MHNHVDVAGQLGGHKRDENGTLWFVIELPASALRPQAANQVTVAMRAGQYPKELKPGTPVRVQGELALLPDDRLVVRATRVFWPRHPVPDGSD